MPEIQWKCTECSTIFNSKSDAISCEESHLQTVQSATIKAVNWATPNDPEKLFHGSSFVDSGKTTARFVDHYKFRTQFPKMVDIEFGTNNGVEKQVATYVICRVGECHLETQMTRDFYELTKKKKR